MGDSAAGNRAVVVVVRGDHGPALRALLRTTRCDLDLVGRLLWLKLQARRAGGDVVLEDVDEELRGLLGLVGAESLLLATDELPDIAR